MPKPLDSLLARTDRELWLVTSRDGDRRGGLIATFAISASIAAKFPRVLVGLAKSHFTWQLVTASGAFGLHLLGESNLDWVGRFGTTSGRDGNKFAGLEATTGPTGSPLVEGAIGWLDCRVEERFDIGDRTLFLGEVVSASDMRDEPALTERAMLRRAAVEQRAEMKRQFQADAVLDAKAIEAWRSGRNGAEIGGKPKSRAGENET